MLTIILILVPIVLLFANICHYAVNVPRQDDYDAVLDFMNHFKPAGTAERLAMMLNQHNEHRIILTRLTFVTCYLLTGTVNFKVVIFINFFYLLLLFTAASYFVRKALPMHWPWAVIVLSYCLFDLHGFENADFAMAGPQNYGVIMLFLGSLFCYTRARSGYLPAAILLQVLCIYSSGNGNIAAVFIVLCNLLMKDRRKIAASIGTLLVFAPLYYYHYGHQQTGFFTLEPGKVIPFFLHLLGGHYGYKHGIASGSITLLLLALCLPPGSRLAVPPQARVLLCIAGFLLASIAITSIYRGNLARVLSTSSRYLIYPDLLTVILFIFLAFRLRSSLLLRPVLFVLTVAAIFVYRHNYEDGKGGFEWFNTTMTTTDFDYPDPVRAKKIADESCRQGIYCIDEFRRKPAVPGQ